MNSQLMALFAAWRADIDSVPFAYEAEWSSLTRSLLGDPWPPSGAELVGTHTGLPDNLATNRRGGALLGTCRSPKHHPDPVNPGPVRE